MTLLTLNRMMNCTMFDTHEANNIKYKPICWDKTLGLREENGAVKEGTVTKKIVAETTLTKLNLLSVITVTSLFKVRHYKKIFRRL